MVLASGVLASGVAAAETEAAGVASARSGVADVFLHSGEIGCFASIMLRYV